MRSSLGDKENRTRACNFACTVPAVGGASGWWAAGAGKVGLGLGMSAPGKLGPTREHCRRSIPPEVVLELALHSKRTRKMGHRSRLQGELVLALSLPRVINFNFPCSFTRDNTPHCKAITCLFIADSDERCLRYQFPLSHLCFSLWKVGRMYFLNLGVKGSMIM